MTPIRLVHHAPGAPGLRWLGLGPDLRPSRALLKLQRLLAPDPALAELAQTIRHKLVEAPPLSLSEGDLINDGVDPLLDGLRNQLDDQDAWLSHQEQQERQRSGISTLKLQHHRTFGYFLAVSKAKATAVPDHWIRRQTLANEERFITPDLKEREGRIFQLRARACHREYELFCQLREQVGAMAAPLLPSMPSPA